MYCQLGCWSVCAVQPPLSRWARLVKYVRAPVCRRRAQPRAQDRAAAAAANLRRCGPHAHKVRRRRGRQPADHPPPAVRPAPCGAPRRCRPQAHARQQLATSHGGPTRRVAATGSRPRGWRGSCTAFTSYGGHVRPRKRPRTRLLRSGARSRHRRRKGGKALRQSRAGSDAAAGRRQAPRRRIRDRRAAALGRHAARPCAHACK
jgi:hypothetical protein